MLGPLGWVILGLIPPLILMLYFLKLKRTPLEVPSTYLWTKTIEDLHVNSIWQRLRNSLLLLLQLLLALLLILACLGPGCRGEKLLGNRFIFLIDQSASMAAVDLPDGETRLEFAKREVSKLIDSMGPEDTAMVISFSNQANVQQSYTRNRALLKRKVSAIKQTQRSSDISEALVAASGLANPGRTSDRETARDVQVADALSARLFVFSDGAVTAVPNFSLGNLIPEYRPIGGLDVPYNVGITAFAINDDRDTTSLQAFAQIQNFDDQDHAVDVELYVDGEIQDVQTDFTVEAGDLRGISFDLGALLEGLEQTLPVRLEIKSPDVYEIDNVAFGVVQPPEQIRVLLVTRNNPYLKFVFETDLLARRARFEVQEPRFLETKEYAEKATLGRYDLVLFDQCVPPIMPESNTVFFGSLPPGGQWSAMEKQFPTLVIDTDNTHPVMFNVQMGNVLIVESTPVSGPLGNVPLMESTSGVLMAVGPRDGYEDLVLGFSILEYTPDGEEIYNSDWPNHLSFPLFIQNIVTSLGDGGSFNEAEGTQPGGLVRIKPKLPMKKITIRNPLGQDANLSARAERQFVYGKTEMTGIYQVLEPDSDRQEQMFAINLLDSRESDLSVREKLEIGYEEIAGTVETVPEFKQYWTWLVFVSLFVLVIEWFIYNRRVFI